MRAEKNRTELVIVDERVLRDKIYVIRGVKVMLDFELAEIYGFTTSAFNQQIKRNIERFDEDFRFQLTREETERLSISQNVTSIQTKGVRGGRAKPPFAFTESGIYMLMTVLKGDLAVQQSKALIRTFRAMKDYIVENQTLIGQHDYLRLSMQVSDTQQAVHAIQTQLVEHEERLSGIFAQMSETVKRSEIAPFLLDMAKPVEKREYLFLNGQPAKADATYMSIYGEAKKTVFIVDNYSDIKTPRLLKDIRTSVSVTVFSDNIGNRLHKRDYVDFHTEFPAITVNFLTTGGIMHDRFIVLDFGTSDEKMYHCGASSKDAGVSRMTAITELTDDAVKASFRAVITQLLNNSPLILK